MHLKVFSDAVASQKSDQPEEMKRSQWAELTVLCNPLLNHMAISHYISPGHLKLKDNSEKQNPRANMVKQLGESKSL